MSDTKFTPPRSASEAVLRMAQDGDADPLGTAALNYPHLFPDLDAIADALDNARDYVSDAADGAVFYFTTKMTNAAIHKTAKEQDLPRLDACRAALAKARGQA